MAFIPKTWADDQTVYAADMNRIEQGISDAVSVTPQTLRDAQKTQARENIGAAQQPIFRSVTLSASGWNSSSKTQTVTVSGVLADETKQLITPTPALASQTAYYEAVVLCTGQAANQLTFTAKKIPTADLTVYVTIQEVSA